MYDYCKLCLILLGALPTVAMAQARFVLPDEPSFASDEISEETRASNGDPRITGCLVDLVHDIQLPATEAGVLVHLGVKEGDQVSSEQLVATIDDREAVQARSIAEYAKKAADALAEDEIEIKYSEAAAGVAFADLLSLREANQRSTKSVPEIDIKKAELEFKRAKFGIEKALKDQQMAALDAGTKNAELIAAQLGIDKRRILAPFDGEILEVLREQQEWVQPGDTIVRIAKLDTLKVDGWVYYDDCAPTEVNGREVTIEVTVADNQVVEATGRVVYVSPLAKGYDRAKYRVRAEIENRREGGHWLISPGLYVTMTIHLAQ